MSTHGRDFDRAQRAYDAQEPPDDEPTRECDNCGEEYIPEYYEDDDTGPHIVSSICDKCKEKSVVTCNQCQETFNTDEGVMINDICKSCYQRNEEGPQTP